jgi:hypothetical protein
LGLKKFAGLSLKLTENVTIPERPMFNEVDIFDGALFIN